MDIYLTLSQLLLPLSCILFPLYALNAMRNVLQIEVSAPNTPFKYSLTIFPLQFLLQNPRKFEVSFDWFLFRHLTSNGVTDCLSPLAFAPSPRSRSSRAFLGSSSFLVQCLFFHIILNDIWPAAPPTVPLAISLLFVVASAAFVCSSLVPTSYILHPINYDYNTHCQPFIMLQVPKPIELLWTITKELMEKKKTNRYHG